MKQFIRFALGVLCLVATPYFASAQAGDYSLTVSSGTFSPLGASATNVPSIEADTDTEIIGIGFDFDFEGITYDTIVASSNGIISFNPSASSNTTNNLDNVAAGSRPLLAPLWDDLDGRAPNNGSKANYLLSGTAPNRVFTFEWIGYEWNWVSSDSTVSFQVKLYEGTNEIEFIYNNNGKIANNPSASIGLTGLNTFLSLSGLGSGTVSTSNTVETSNIDTVVTGQIFRFIPPACPSVSLNSFTNITGDSLTINWTGNGSGPWYVNWGPTGFSQGSPTSNYDTTTTVSLTVGGLNSGTTYDFYISEDCGGGNQSNWAGPFSATTAYSPSYLEDWSAGYPGPDFSETNGLVGEPSNLSGTSSNWTEDGMGNMGSTGAAKINIFGSGVDEWLIGPSIDLGNGSTSYQAEFDAALTTWNQTSSNTLGSDDTVRFIISTDNGMTWNRSNTLIMFTSSDNIPNGTGAHYVADLSSYTGIVKFAFYAESTSSNADNDFFVDNFQVRVPPSCPTPSQLALVRVATDSAIVNWISSETAFNVEYGVAPYTQGTGGNVIAVTDTFAVINGLLPNTEYEFYVQSDCSAGGGGLSAFSSSQTFRTPCAPYNAPYTEDFDGSSWSPLTTYDACWTVNPNSGFRWQVEDATTGSSDTGPDNDFSGTGNYVYTEATSGGTGDTAFIYSPMVNVSAVANPYLTFRYHMYGSNMGTLNVDFFDGATWQNAVFTITGQQHASGSATWTEGTVNIDGLTRVSDTIQIRFAGIRGNGFRSDMAVDQFRIAQAPACPSPSFDSISAITSTGATINWTSFSGNSNIEWGPAGFNQGSGTGNVILNTSPSNSLTGLTPNTCYDVYIQDTCGASGVSNWIGPFQFCTPVTCPAPSNLGIDPSTLTINSVDLVWTPGGNASNWIVEYGTTGFAPNTGAGTVVIANNDTLNISSLSPGTEYDYYVIDSCGIGDVSTISGPFSFVTAFTTNYLDDFNANGTPFAWLEADGRLTSNTVFTSASSSWTSDNFLNAGGGQNGQKVNVFTSNQYEWLISPSIYLDPTITNLQVEFDAAVTVWNQSTQGYMGSDDTLALVISTDNGATWDIANTLWVSDANDTLDASGEHIVVPLTGYNGYVRFGLYTGSVVDDTQDNDVFVDHFEVRTPAACTNPSGLTVSNVGTDTAMVSWTAGDALSTSWSLIYTVGNQPASAGTVINASNDTLILTGLSSNTAYCVYLVESCPFGMSDTIGPECFSTLCNTLSLPYTEDYSVSLGCFTAIDGGSTPDTWNWVNDYNGNTLDGTPFAFVDSDGAGSGNLLSEILVTVDIDASSVSGPIILEYDQYFNNIGNDSGFVEVFDGSNWNTVVSIGSDLGGWSAPDHDSIDISAFANANMKVRFRYEDNNVWAWYWAVDNIHIYEGSSCVAPSNLAAANANCDSIELSWTSDPSSTYSQIEYGLAGFTKGTGATITNASSPLTISGLTLDEDYEFYVLDSCATGAICVGPFAFKSDSIGPLLASFTHNQVTTTATDADVDFDASASTNATSYSWDFGNGTLGGGMNPTVTYDTNGTYMVTLTVTDKCGNTDDTTIAVVVGGISIIENLYNAEVSLYPNPTNGVFKVNVSNGSSDYEVQVHDLSGRLIYRKAALSLQEEHTLDIGNKAAGVYTVKIIGQGLNISRRLMVK